MADVDFSLLDLPRETPPPDPEAYLRAAMAWHFGADTGSPYWLRTAQRLDFDPLTDVRTFADLRRFPNLVNELRDVPAHDLIPRGYGTPPPVPLIFESGGTTGAPKRTAQLPDWVAQVVDWQTDDFRRAGFVPGGGFLCLMPSGPHGVGHFSRAVSARLGSICHTVDLDPRWVKKLVARGAAAEMSVYLNHLLEQAEHALRSQHIVNLHTTPPLLDAIARDGTLTQLVGDTVRFIMLSGAHVDPDTLDVLHDVFPDAAIAMVFGSTMILSQAQTRSGGEQFVFDPRSPYVVFWVVNADTGEPVGYGERGQVVMNHISKGMFIPNNLERDTAIRLPGPDGHVGDSVAEVAPVATLDGEAVIEGVY
ncbi:AMP-binding protein [Mycolicibacterium rhodesiae]|uniref:Phenazine antibiotic biosynthesis protein n=1 Tax=Mycolicibacterium rhodesiae TaxID=36814 RepID=A0A1X0IY48_MYCRH|nr:AMP-binding protein [Mycolicibacterium rhodesiae]MCV7346521.1 AMP-binding protein [Mycolicibacterium rhodesiae]ORB53762.1 phenazine antibiotic biosynthesis protein [Mycolicibacterium rhodesiae]